MPQQKKEKPQIKLTEVSIASVSLGGNSLDNCSIIKVEIGDAEFSFLKTKSYKTKMGSHAWTGRIADCNTQLVVTQYNGITWGFSSSPRGYLRFVIKNGVTKIYTCPLKMAGVASCFKSIKTISKIATPSYIINLAVAYNQAYLDSAQMTYDELVASHENMVAYHNMVLNENMGWEDVFVETNGYQEVQCYSDATTYIEQINFDYESEANGATELHNAVNSLQGDLLIFYTVMFFPMQGSTTAGAAAGIVDQFHHDYNIITFARTVDTTTPLLESHLAHETGHLFGFNHDWAVTSGNVNELLPNNGYIDGSSGTIMSYANTIYPYYSNVSINGLGKENRDNYSYGNEVIKNGMTRLQFLSQSWSMKDIPALKFKVLYDDFFDSYSYDGYGFTYRTINVGDSFDLMDGAMAYSPVGNNVTITNIGDEVDTTTPGLYLPILELKDDSNRVNYKYIYVRVNAVG